MGDDWWMDMDDIDHVYHETYLSHEQTRNGTRTKALESAALFDAREKRTIPQNGGRILPNGMEMWRIVRSLVCE